MWQNNSIGLEPISTEVSPFGTVTEKSKQILDLVKIIFKINYFNVQMPIL